MRALILALLLLSACDYYGGPAEKGRVRQTHRVGSLKLISPAIGKGDDPKTYGQESFRIGPERRLLMRYENLTRLREKIIASEDEPFWLKVRLEDPEQWPESEPLPLRVCPIARNWMMLATWQTAHPYGTTGEWESPGGDLELEECVEPAKRKGSLITFDLTRWYLLSVEDRGRNFGLALVSDSEIRVSGKIEMTWFRE